MRNYDVEEVYKEPLEAFDIWLKQSGYTQLTVNEYKRDVIKFLAYLNEKPIESVKKMHIAGYLATSRANTGDKTLNRKLAAIRTFYKALNTYEILDKNPAIEVQKSKTEKNKKPIYLDQEDLGKLIHYIDGRYKNRNIAIYLLMSYAGFRVGEVHRLNLKNFNKSRGTVELFGKGRKWNEIPLPELIIQYLTEVEKERIAPNSQKDDAFFVSQKGRRLSIRQIQKIMAEIFDRFREVNPKYEDMPLSCHKLRHSFATMLLDKGVDIRIVKELMGHSSIETTMIYTHVNNEQKKNAMDKLNIPQFV
jgi:integrase/recombinase XerD